MKALVFGKTGQLGQSLAQADATLTLDLCDAQHADFTNPAACAALVAATDADVVINAAAYTAVDRAEAEEALAHQINAETPGALARAAAARGLPFVQVSTDYVFDGSGQAPWRPDDAPGPLNAYGRTKLAGEEAVRAAGGVHVILRTSWVVSAHGSNFIRTMLRLGAERDVLNIVADQVGGPTPAADLAQACLAAARGLAADPGCTGTYHFAGAPDVSWAGFAREIFAQAGMGCKIVDIPTTDYPTPAIRPLNSRLDCSTFESTFALKRPDWRVSLRTILTDLGAIS